MKKRVPGLTAAALERFILRVRRVAGLKGSVDVLVTGKDEMRRLNRQYRGKNQATDVLSFPAVDGMPSIGASMAGDLAVCVDIAAENARLLGHTAGEEVKILVLHGVLHLAGYDHERDNGRMARKEQELRRLLKLPTGLIERTHLIVSKAAPGRVRMRGKA